MMFEVVAAATADETRIDHITLGCPLQSVSTNVSVSVRFMLHAELIKPVHTVAEKCDNLSQKSATVAEFGDCRRCLAVFCDSRTFLRQCGQGYRRSQEFFLGGALLSPGRRADIRDRKPRPGRES